MDVDAEEIKVENVNLDTSDTTENLTFDNLTLIKEFSNIANAVSDEEFINTVPKAKNLKRVKWTLLFDCLKQSMREGMVQDMNTMWLEENMPLKLEILDRQREKFKDITESLHSWRPQLGDVASQLKSHDVAALQKQKEVLETIAKEYETRCDNLQKSVSAKRSYIQAVQFDIQRYQKRSEDFVTKIQKRLENHKNQTNIITSKNKTDDVEWSEKDLETNESIKHDEVV